MSVDLTIAHSDPVQVRHRRRWVRQERKRLHRQDQLAARAAELHRIRDLLEGAVGVVNSGWVQHDWFAVTGDRGEQHKVNAHNLHLLSGAPVSAACLVGAIVHVAGGPSATQTQLLRRTLDLTWHALHEDEHQLVRWCPPPAVRAARVRDLTRWNDKPGRTADEVTVLLRSAIRLANAQTGSLLAERSR
jgi:hypothetical protein